MVRKRLWRLRPGRFLAIPLFLIQAQAARAAVSDISVETSYDFAALLKAKESLLEVRKEMQDTVSRVLHKRLGYRS